MFFPLQVEIKRTIPKGAAQSKDFKTKKIFVGGIPATVTGGIPCILLESHVSVYRLHHIPHAFLFVVR